MDNLKDANQDYTTKIHAATNEQRNSNKSAKASYCLTDVQPGTSKLCDGYSSGQLAEATFDAASAHSVESFVCRICQNNENPENLISPCLCKGSLTYVHSNCLERWISLSACTSCELCQYQYNTEQTLRYSLYQSLRLWYSRSMSRRALQKFWCISLQRVNVAQSCAAILVEDCQMFLLLTLIAFGIVGTLLVAIQYYILQSHVNGLGRVWTKGWLVFFLLSTLIVYSINVYMIAKAQLLPWYRWWHAARDIRLIIENRNPTCASLKQIKNDMNFCEEPLEGSMTQSNAIC